MDQFPGGVNYAPSCQILQLAQNQQRPDFTHLFAIQNPTEDLDYSDLEVEVLKQHFHTSHILTKSDAKKSAIDNQQLQTSHCVHFSCHGYFNFEHPLLSELNLADCNIIRENVPAIDLTKCLTLAEIFTLDLSQCRLVTLSACETGLTDFRYLTDDYIGLPSGFLIAGSPSVVSSLWIVNDCSTALLMIKLYKNLHEQHKQQGQLNVAIALNQAQTWLRDTTTAELQTWTNSLNLDENLTKQIQKKLRRRAPNERPFHSPYHWAAFCAIGQ